MPCSFSWIILAGSWLYDCVFALQPDERGVEGLDFLVKLFSSLGTAPWGLMDEFLWRFFVFWVGVWG